MERLLSLSKEERKEYARELWKKVLEERKQKEGDDEAKTGE
jgi:hypothetical protein